MVSKLILYLVPLLLLYQSSGEGLITQPKPYDDGEAYEIYSTLLPSGWPWRVANAKRLVISNESGGHKMCLPKAEPKWEKIIGEAISEYVKLNQHPWLLQRQFKIEKPYDLVTPNEFKAALGQGNWDNFYRHYPDSGGLIHFSAVGFNTDKTVAVVYMSHSCGLRCGHGEYHFLQKIDGKWVPLDWIGERCSWSS